MDTPNGASRKRKTYRFLCSPVALYHTIPYHTNNQKTCDEEKYPVVTIPYVRTISEKIARSFKEHGIKTVHQPSTKIKNILFNNKDKVHHLDKSGIIYEVNCKKHRDLYVGEKLEVQ